MYKWGKNENAPLWTTAGALCLILACGPAVWVGTMLPALMWEIVDAWNTIRARVSPFIVEDEFEKELKKNVFAVRIRLPEKPKPGSRIVMS